MDGIVCNVFIVLSILFLNILLWSIYYVYPQPDLYIIKINRYSNIATMTHVRMRMYILSLIYFIYQFIINIHPYTCMHTYTHQHTHAYIGMHQQGGYASIHMHPYIHMHPQGYMHLQGGLFQRGSILSRILYSIPILFQLLKKGAR